MRVLVVSAALIVASLFVLALFLPIRIRLGARIGLDRVAIKIAVKPPLVPWYIPLPELARMRSQASGDRPGSRTASRRIRSVDPVEEPAGTVKEQGQYDSGRSLATKVRDGLSGFRAVLPLFRETLRQVAGSIRVREFRLKGYLGVGDAFQTALLLGGVNSVASLFLKLLRRQGFRFDKKPVVRFRPRYDAIAFSATADIETAISVVDCVKLALGLRRAGRPLLEVAKGPSQSR